MAKALKELHSLNHKKSGGQFMAKFATTLSDVKSLLTETGQVDYLYHSGEVDRLIDILPHSEKAKYIERVESYGPLSNFQKFEKFLNDRTREEDR